MKKMSKILSVILALCMVISLIPASFAAEGDAANTKIVYDFVDSYSDAFYEERTENSETAVQNILKKSYDYTNGFWMLGEGGKVGYPSFNHYYKYVNKYGVTTDGVRVYFEKNDTGTKDRCWFSMKIKVPVAGNYIPSLKYDQASSFEKELKIYILDVNTTKAEIDEKVSDPSDTAGFVGTVDSCGDAKDKTTSLSLIPLEAKEYLVVFYSPNYNNIRIKNLTLTSGDGSKVVPMNIDVSVNDNKTSLDAVTSGDAAQISVNSVIYSDTTKKTEGVSATDFIYTSSDTSLAAVDANGKVTVAPTAVTGNVDINIAAKDNPGFVLDTVSFDIIASKTTNTKIVYDFIDNYAEGVPYKDKVDKNGNSTLENNFYAEKGEINEVPTYNESNGFWKFYLQENAFSVNHQWKVDDSKPWNQGLYAYFGSEEQHPNKSWFAIKIRVPVSDIYSVSIGTISNSAFETELETYLLDGNSAFTAIAESIASGKGKLGTVNCKQGGYQALDSERRFLSKVNLQKGEYVVVFHSVNDIKAKIWSLEFKAGNGTNIIPMSAEISADDVETGKSAVIALNKVHMSNATSATTVAGITYESSDSSVLSVSGTNATGVKAGTAKIYAKYNNEIIGETEVTVTAPVVEPEAAPTIITYGQYDNVNGKVSVNEAAPGTELTFTAEEIDGYTFRYWVLGSAATGRYYSSEKSVMVKPYVNIALTAIYTAKNDGVKVVDLFNYNGEFLKTLTDLSDLANEKPAMIGHTFADKWLIDEETELTADTVLTAPVTQAVAQYTKNTGYETKNVSNGSAYGWIRNGKLVTYDEDYTFLTWLNQVGTIAKNTKAVTDKIPLAVLENNGNAYMLEYDKGNYKIVEAGILFGKDADVDVKSAYSKAKVKDIKAHGQFTASPMDSETYARGYIIYEDGNEYKVIYAD